VIRGMEDAETDNLLREVLKYAHNAFEHRLETLEQVGGVLGARVCVGSDHLDFPLAGTSLLP